MEGKTWRMDESKGKETVKSRQDEGEAVESGVDG